MGMRLNGNETELFMVSVNNIAAANVISFSLSGYIQNMAEFEAAVQTIVCTSMYLDCRTVSVYVKNFFIFFGTM